MSRHIICDLCGRLYHDNAYSFASDGGAGLWLHHYQTGKDECPVCIEKRMKAESNAMWARIRADKGLTKETPK